MNAWVVLVTVLASGLTADPAGDPPDPGADAKKPARAGPPRAVDPGIDRPSLKEALEAVRRDYRPLILIYFGGEAESRFARDMKDSLEDPAVRKAIKAFVVSELSAEVLAAPYPAPPAAGPPSGPAVPRGRPPVPGEGPAGAGKKGPAGVGKADPAPPGPKDPPDPSRAAAAGAPAGERLGVVAGVPSLLVLDFRERVARRYQEKFPRREALRKELLRFAAEMARLAEAARRVEKVLEKAEYSYALGETREAVLLVLPLDDGKIRRGLDAVLSERLASVLGRYKNDGSAAMATGEALESEGRFLEAVEAYRQAALRFPFPEILKASARKGSDAMRKARGGL